MFFLIGEGLIIFSYTKKRIVTNLFIFAVAFSIIGCTIEKRSIDTYDCAKVVYDYLDTQGVNKCQVEKLGSYTNLQYSNTGKDEYGLFDVNEMYYLLKSISEATVFNLDDNEVVNYSIIIVQRFEELAEMKAMSLEQYYEKELELNEKEFYNLCYDMGENDIKTKLIVESVASKRRN